MSPEERASRANSVDGLMQTFPQTMELESRIASEIRHAIQKSRRQAFLEVIEICNLEKVSGETGTEGDIAYNVAIDHCIEAIQQHMEKP